MMALGWLLAGILAAQVIIILLLVRVTAAVSAMTLILAAVAEQKGVTVPFPRA
jgi:hypothetical protein